VALRIPKLRVRNSGIVRLDRVRDYPDGDLFIAEAQKEIPFAIRRVYFINNLANAKAIRGKHAHRTLEQVIFCINGSFVLQLDDGATKQRLTLSDPSIGIRLRPLVWHTMSGFSKDCVILVLASARFAEKDYIRDYAEFRDLAVVADG
jgi:hypothetical protein